ncbi:putative baseplate assembly protein [Janthinobacterium fluminis]|uniref:Baseplate assembly protein n=1 Tax=Janthinobacterium fluminis TaxID=2987524 RepID=A0ABT5JXX3_9BURK|nr:putative baseplate assembly protein [Janthinobacterium fluminis]MDC8757003.1 putative baseplate assembly protein [Janthinobacterium fluminis]
MRSSDLACRQSWRRRHLFQHPRWNGVDFLEVSDEQRYLCVHFFGSIPEGIGVANVRIEGGRRIRDLRVLRVEIDRSGDPDQDDCLRITLDRIGDYSTYRLCFVERVTAQEGAAYRPFPGLDPRYACLDFRFRLDCAADQDCRVQPDCPPAFAPAPEIDYLAKDYASLRQMMLDRMALTMPGWQERHVPDLGVTLVELLAYTADYLSYYQDAVATEAYLDTARQRISVRRHVRLIDYRMHEGCNARAFVTLDTDSDIGPLLLVDCYFITGFAALEAEQGRVLPHELLAKYPPQAYDVFEPVAAGGAEGIRARAAHSTMHFYTWGDTECCLSRGATRASLIDGPQWSDDEAAPDAGRVLDLHAGDVLIFEEVKGATTGAPADADPARRHAVLLTSVTPALDQLFRQPVLEIEWAAGDALPFSLCLSARLPAQYDCARIADITVARGNVVLVDHGRRAPPDPLGPVLVRTELGECACEGSVIETSSVPQPFRPRLKHRALTYRVPFQPSASAQAMLAQDPRQALPDLALAQRQAGAADAGWQARYDLLASGVGERHFVVEMDDERNAHLRFGDGELGRQPAAGAVFDTRYRVGGGAAGNVGRDAITYMVYRPGLIDGAALMVRNPLPAQGGVEPEPLAEVKLFAPGAFRKQRLRAVTAADYAELAQQNASIQRAAADLSWTGSWYEARVAVDPLGVETLVQPLREEIEAALQPYRRIGHDLAVVQARYVPISLTLHICVLAHYTRGEVRARLQQVLGNRQLPNGERGLFHPDRLSFGDGLHLSRIVAAAAGVEGVERVKVLRLQRLDVPDDPLAATPQLDPAIAEGTLALGPTEIAQLDNDPDFPENGALTLILGGGR